MEEKHCLISRHFGRIQLSREILQNGKVCGTIAIENFARKAFLPNDNSSVILQVSKTAKISVPKDNQVEYVQFLSPPPPGYSFAAQADIYTSGLTKAGAESPWCTHRGMNVPSPFMIFVAISLSKRYK